MANTYNLSFVTPEKLLIEEPVVELIAPGVEGELGVLAHHAPLITELLGGVVSVYRDKGQQALRYQISGGFLHVRDNAAVLLADTAAPL